MPVEVVVGGQWGDEGKGKAIDYLAAFADVIGKAHGGDNAGHSVKNPRGKFALHLVPAGIFYPDKTNIIGAGVVINPETLIGEMIDLRKRGVDTSNLWVSERAHLTLPYHQYLDRKKEEARKDPIGTTGKGVGPTYEDQAARIGLRAEILTNSDRALEQLEKVLDAKRKTALDSDKDQYDPSLYRDLILNAVDEIGPHITRTEKMISDSLDKGERILIEGSHGTLLDLDYGTYPFVTSSKATVAGCLQGLAVPPGTLTHSWGIFKAYQTRVGEGPMPTELIDEIGDEIRKTGHEYGTTTGRPRRCGWFDAVAARHAQMINGFDRLNISLLDVLDNLDPLLVCTAYELDGRTIDYIPANAADFARCKPVYKEMPGWKADITEARRFDELPSQAVKYLMELTSHIPGATLALIGNGEDRENLIRTRF